MIIGFIQWKIFVKVVLLLASKKMLTGRTNNAEKSDAGFSW